jgi:hypothetical protein
MSENDTLDGGMPAQGGSAPSFLNVICILSYIGKGLLALLFLIGAFATTWILSFFTSAMDSGMEGMEGLEGYDAAELEQAASAMDSFATMGSGLIMGVFLFFALLQILALIGVARMHKLKKSGFVLYIIGNGIFAVLLLLGMASGGSPLLALLTVGFIVMYIINRKALVH